MARVTQDVLDRRRLVRGIRARVRFELANAQDQILNDVENSALERFDAALARGEDTEYVADELLGAVIDVRAALQ